MSIINGIENKIFTEGDNFEIKDTTFMLVLCPQVICDYQGLERQDKEGKKYNGAYYNMNIEGAKFIIKKKLEENIEKFKLKREESELKISSSLPS